MFFIYLRILSFELQLLNVQPQNAETSAVLWPIIRSERLILQYQEKRRYKLSNVFFYHFLNEMPVNWMFFRIWNALLTLNER